MEKNNVINELLNSVMVKKGITTDYKLAQVLEVKRQKVFSIRAGSEKPNSYVCAKIAIELGRDPLEIIAMVEAASAKNEQQRAFWRSLKFSGMRNVGLMLCGMLTFFGTGWHGGNANASTETTSYNVYYVKLTNH